jgi:hypothetical protein
VLFSVMHRVDRLEDCLRRHAAGVDAKRCMIGVVAHKEQNVRTEIRRRSRRRESSGTASNNRDGLTFFHECSNEIMRLHVVDTLPIVAAPSHQ